MNNPFPDCNNFAEILEKRRTDFPQAIVAGWMLPSGQPVSTATVACDKRPTEGEMAVAWGACLAACLKKIDDMCAADPKLRDKIMQLVALMVGNLEIVDRFKNDLCKVKEYAEVAK